MVRAFPVDDSLTANDGWQWHGHPKGLESVHEVVWSRLYENENTDANFKFPVICREVHPSHSFGVFYGANPLQSSFTSIFLEIVIVILTTRIVRFLLKPLRQPRIISEIIGGLFIGPSMLRHNKNFKRYMLPDNSDFVLRNIGLIGFMLFVFVSGVKMDLSFVKKAGKKHYYVALIGVLTPFFWVFFVGLTFRGSMDKNLSKYSSIGAVAASLAITTFPVINLILRDLNLLNSEVGRFAMSASIISDAVGLNAVVAFEAALQGEKGAKSAFWFVISLVILIAFVLIAIRRIMIWIIKKTPEGSPVDQGFVVGILLGVMAMGFLTDMFGIAIANGPLWLGLVIPDGPPLGSALVERTETIIMEIFMPFAFAMVGLYTDFFAMADAGWSTLAPLFALFLTGYLTKFVATVVTAFLFETTLRDSLTLGLIMSLRGEVELILYIHWSDKGIIQKHCFGLLVILTIAVSGTLTPLISILYDPTRPYMVNKRRTVQHTPPCTELRIVLCAPDQESAAGLISLLEFSYPTISNPFSIHALHLVELVGRAAPVFIDHEEKELELEDASQHGKFSTAGREAIHILKHYQESRAEFVKLHAYTAVAPRQTMYQDVCELALLNKASFIVLPFHKERRLLRDHGFLQSVNSDVLANAPCSVGVFYNKAQLQNPLVAAARNTSEHKVLKFAVLFLGGADSRETLAYADRMTCNPDINLTVVRFFSHNYEGDDEMEKKLDDGVVTWFWVKNESNERVVYKEVEVENGAETLAAIKMMNDINHYDLWITGRNEGINPKPLEGLSAWVSRDNDLGVIGDYVASEDFGVDASVLVIQQQILRGQERAATKQIYM